MYVSSCLSNGLNSTISGSCPLNHLSIYLSQWPTLSPSPYVEAQMETRFPCLSCSFVVHDGFEYRSIICYFWMPEFDIKITNEKISWFLSLSYIGWLGFKFLKSHTSKLPLLASPFPPVKSKSLLMCIVLTSSLCPLRVPSMLSVTRSQIVIFFSQAVNMSLLSGSTMTYLTNPPRWGPERSDMILLV